MTPEPPAGHLQDLRDEELLEVVRDTVDELQNMLDRLRRHLGEDGEEEKRDQE